MLFIDPLIKYRTLNRADTVAMAEQEKAFWDAAIDAEGEDGVIDTEPVLNVRLLRGKPKQATQSRTDEIPTQAEPRRSILSFAGKAELAARIETMGGRSLRIGGTVYTISNAFPHSSAGVAWAIELQCDINDGLYMTAGKDAIF
jgi:hypothetical protein